MKNKLTSWNRRRVLYVEGMKNYHLFNGFIMKEALSNNLLSGDLFSTHGLALPLGDPSNFKCSGFSCDTLSRLNNKQNREINKNK